MNKCKELYSLGDLLVLFFLPPLPQYLVFSRGKYSTVVSNLLMYVCYKGLQDDLERGGLLTCLVEPL